MVFVEISMKTMRLAASFAWLMVGLSLGPALFAQNGTGSARGTVTDAQGGAIAGAAVTLTNVVTAYSRGEKTDAHGNYGVQSPPVARYTLTVSMEGFTAFHVNDALVHVIDSLT